MIHVQTCRNSVKNIVGFELVHLIDLKICNEPKQAKINQNSLKVFHNKSRLLSGS